MEYTINGKTYDTNSIPNQRIKERFVCNNVSACVTDMVSDLIRYSLTYGEDEWVNGFDNIYYDSCLNCNGCSKEATEKDIPAIDEYCREKNLVYTPNDLKDWYVCEDCGEVYPREESEATLVEVLEYYIVSDFLGRRLRERGEVIMERPGGWIWGRQISGQAILLDSVISDICMEMEILEGQSHCWEKKGWEDAAIY